jgi:hypothetical protein
MLLDELSPLAQRIFLFYYLYTSKSLSLPQNPSDLESKVEVGCWWLTPVILATWEAEIRRMLVPGQPRQKVKEIPSQPISAHNSLHLSPQATQEAKIRKTVVIG